MQRMWDEKYGTEKFFYGTEPNEYFAEKLNLLKTGKILLPGEGEGRNAVFAAKAGWQVLGVDQSFEGKRKALQLAEKENVTITYQFCWKLNWLRTVLTRWVVFIFICHQLW